MYNGYYKIFYQHYKKKFQIKQPNSEPDLAAFKEVFSKGAGVADNEMILKYYHDLSVDICYNEAFSVLYAAYKSCKSLL